MDRIIASWRLTILSSTPAAAICFCNLPSPGSIPSNPPRPPIFCNWRSWVRKSFISNLPEAMRSAMRIASSSSIASAAFSTSATTSPISRMRPAIRSGSKASSASSFSPTPTSFIGQPVVCAMDRAAPPLASPSRRVSTMPLTPTALLKASAVVTASWPVRLSATSKISSGFAADLISRNSAIRASSMLNRPAVSRINTS